MSETTAELSLLAWLLRPLRGYAKRITERSDTEARTAGLTAEGMPAWVRRYRDPRLDQLAAHRTVRYAGVRKAARADAGAWSTPALTSAAGLVVVSCYPPASTIRPDLPVVPTGPAAPATRPPDRLRRADSWQGPGRYQTRSPTSSRPAQDRFHTLRTERCAETILRSRLDPGHPAGPAPGALRAGGKNTRQPAP